LAVEKSTVTGLQSAEANVADPDVKQ